ASLEADVMGEVQRCAALLGDALATRAEPEDATVLRRLAAVPSSLVTVADHSKTASAVVAAACELVGTDSGAVLLGDVDAGFELTYAAGPLERALERMGRRDLD